MPNPDSDLHMAVTELFDGGIVNNAKIALQMAHLILEPLIGPIELSRNLALRVTDHGDHWLIQGSRKQHSGSSGFCDIEIRKRDAAVRVSPRQRTQYLLHEPAAAEKFGAAVLANAAGEAELRRQSPLMIEDKEEIWRVRGSGNADRAIEGPGPFYLEIRKRDARVLDMWFEWTLHTPPEVNELLRAPKK